MRIHRTTSAGAASKEKSDVILSAEREGSLPAMDDRKKDPTPSITQPKEDGTPLEQIVENKKTSQEEATNIIKDLRRKLKEHEIIEHRLSILAQRG